MNTTEARAFLGTLVSLSYSFPFIVSPPEYGGAVGTGRWHACRHWTLNVVYNFAARSQIEVRTYYRIGGRCGSGLSLGGRLAALLLPGGSQQRQEAYAADGAATAACGRDGESDWFRGRNAEVSAVIVTLCVSTLLLVAVSVAMLALAFAKAARAFVRAIRRQRASIERLRQEERQARAQFKGKRQSAGRPASRRLRGTALPDTAATAPRSSLPSAVQLATGIFSSSRRSSGDRSRVPEAVPLLSFAAPVADYSVRSPRVSVGSSSSSNGDAAASASADASPATHRSSDSVASGVADSAAGGSLAGTGKAGPDSAEWVPQWDGCDTRNVILKWTDVLELPRSWTFVSAVGTIGLAYYCAAVAAKDFDPAGNAEGLVLAVSSALLWLSMLQYGNLSPGVYAAVLTLKSSAPNIAKFVLGSVPIFIALSMFAMIVFSVRAPRFANPSITLVTLYAFFNGDAIRETFLHTENVSNRFYTIVGDIHLVITTLIFTYVVINCTVALVEEAFFVTRTPDARKELKRDKKSAIRLRETIERLALPAAAAATIADTGVTSGA
jgi:type II secretory pathway pseudopilin PulG